MTTTDKGLSLESLKIVGRALYEDLQLLFLYLNYKRITLELRSLYKQYSLSLSNNSLVVEKCKY